MHTYPPLKGEKKPSVTTILPKTKILFIVTNKK